MGCRGCSKKKVPVVQTFKVVVEAPENIDPVEIRNITNKLKARAKELINES